LARHYVNALNSGTVPVIKSTWDSIVEIETKKLYETAIKLYKTNMDKKLTEADIFEEQVLDSEHRTQLILSLSFFREKTLTEIDVKYNEQAKKLRDDIEKYYSDIRIKNDQKSQTSSEKLAHTMVISIEDEIKLNKISTLDQLENRWAVLLQQYLKNAKGPQKYNIVEKALQQHMLIMAKRIQEISIKEITRKYEEEGRQEQSRYSRLDDTYKSLNKNWETSKAQNEKLNGDMMVSTKQLSDIQTENIKLRENVAYLKNDQLAKLQQDLEKTLADLKQQKNVTEKTQTDLDQTKQILEKSQLQVKQLTEQNNKLQDDLKLTTSKLQEESKQLSNKLQDENKQQKSKIDVLENDLTIEKNKNKQLTDSKNIEVQGLNQQITNLKEQVETLGKKNVCR